MNGVDYLNLWNGQRGAGEHVKCVGIRGGLEPPGKPNRLGIYDDLIVRCMAKDVTMWRASVDPGSYYLSHPIQGTGGAAQLVDGVHVFKPGPHRQHWMAFVQAEPFRINRLDSDGNVIRAENGDFGIHLHGGGAGDEVGVYSAGCQIIHDDTGYFGRTWHNFYDPAITAMAAAGQTTMPYLLVDANTLPVGHVSDLVAHIAPHLNLFDLPAGYGDLSQLVTMSD